MKVSQLFVKTLREVPSSAEIPSHIFLLRGGYIKQLAAGLYTILPLGKRVLSKIEAILREEMDQIGGQEVDMPLVHPSELWKETGRYDAIGSELVKFKDRAHHDMVLAMTHEEAATDLLKSVISSYKQLPAMVYQIKLKFRDEPRSRGGLIRVREFMMKDGYSFHETDESLDEYYQQAYKAYQRIFARVGITPIIVESDTGIMGGKAAHEFMLETECGEDYLILSEDGSYMANQEIAQFDRESVSRDLLEVEKVETPTQKTIEEVSQFLGAQPNEAMKAVLFTADKNLILVLVRGDLNVSEIKIKNYLQTPELHVAEDDFIRSYHIEPGFASAVNQEDKKNLKILVDFSIAEGNNFIGGANEKGFHLKNLNFKRDFNSNDVGDFAMAQSGYKCIHSESRLKAVKGIEIGNIFKLGTKFSTSMKAEFLDRKGRSQPVIMGCYGIGIGRLMASVVENSHDKFGPIWPKSIAPYQVHLLNIGGEKEVMEACESLYASLQSAGFEVLFDDRNERPGVKFKDADLWGIPLRLGISKKTLAESACEWKERSEKGFVKVPLSDLPSKIKELF